jgi:RHS repeat-associated protein
MSFIRHFYFTSGWQTAEERLGTTPSAQPADRQFVWGRRYIDDLVLRDVNLRKYAILDANWSTVAAVDDESTEFRLVYSPFGLEVVLNEEFQEFDGEIDWEYRFTGLYIGSTKLIDARYRTLSPRLGVWMSRDPVEYADGPSLYLMSFAVDGMDPFGTTIYRENPDTRSRVTCELESEAAAPAAICTYRLGQMPPIVENIDCPSERADECCRSYLDEKKGWAYRLLATQEADKITKRYVCTTRDTSGIGGLAVIRVSPNSTCGPQALYGLGASALVGLGTWAAYRWLRYPRTEIEYKPIEGKRRKPKEDCYCMCISSLYGLTPVGRMLKPLCLRYQETDEGAKRGFTYCYCK